MLIVQSALPPRDAVPQEFHAGRFEATFARDALTVIASVSARETDVVLLDTPIFDVDVDVLLLDLERERSKVPVLVLGNPPPGRMSGYPFAVRHLPKPIDAERLRREIDAVVREAAYQRSLPPPQPGGGGDGDGASDFLEWSQLALELAEESGESPASVATEGSAPAASVVPRTSSGASAADEATVEVAGAALAEAAGGRGAAEATVEVSPAAPAEAPPPEADDATVEILRPAPADVPSPTERGPARRDPGVSSSVPGRARSSRPPPPAARGVDVERTLTVEGVDAAAPPLAGRSAAIVGRRIDVATRVSLALYAAGVEVRLLEGGLGDVLPGLRASPPDLLVFEPDGAEDLSRALRELRAEVRLWHRPLLVVAADAEAEALLRAQVPGGPDAVVRADAGEAELVAKAGFLLAPAEQVRERMLREKIAAGEIGPVGVATLVQLAALARPEGRLVLRGEGRLAELDLRGSEVVQARLTEPDGRSFEGSEALLLALTIRSGRFALRPPPVARPLVSLRLPIPQALWDAADRLAGLLRRLAADRLPRVRRLRLRDGAGPIRGLSSVELRARERLQTGDAPRVLAGAPGFDAERVALLVEKLALAGDIVEVEEDDGVAPAAPEAGDAMVEMIDATAVEELPAAAPPARVPSAVRTLFGIPGKAAVRSPPPPSSAVSSPAASPSGAPPPVASAAGAAASPFAPPAAEVPAVPASSVAEAPAPPAALPVGASAPVPEPPAAAVSSDRPSPPLPEAETGPGPETPLVPGVPSGSSGPPPFGVLPAGSAPPDAAGPASPGAGSPVRLAAAGEPAGARRRARAAWLVPIALLALGAAALAVWYVAGRPGGARPGEPGRAPSAALAGDAGRVAVVSAAGAGEVEEPDAGNVASRAPDSAAADAGAAEEAEADRVPRRAVAPDAPVAVAVGPDAPSSPAVGAFDAAPAVRIETAGPALPDAAVAVTAPSTRGDGAAMVPDATGEPDAGRRVVASADRSAGPARDGGVASGGPAVLVVPRPEGVAVEMEVFVDGVRRGVAPLQVELAGGEHELRFEAAGRQSLSIVRLRAGERKTVVPRQLLRQLSAP